MTFKLLKVGSDTEFFLRDLHKGLPEVAIGKFGGTKQNPLPIPELGEGFCIQEDNVMPEVNIPAAENYQDFYVNCQKILTWLKKESKAKGCSLEIAASMQFAPEQLLHPQALNIGCEPDFCVWTRSENEFDLSKRHLLQTLRSAGGHVHVSFKDSTREITEKDRELLVMFLDLTLGVPSVLLDGDMDRKQLYGKAGSFRFKPYGVEYRVLSNFWFRTNQYTAWVFQQVQHAVEYMNTKAAIRLLFDGAEEIQNCINTQNRDLASSIRHSWGLYIP